jgi:hypothetical protein
MVSVVGVPRAYAQCAFDVPAKAKIIKSSLVRAYASCPGATFASPNTTTMAGVPGCAPPTPNSAYEFDDAKGACTLSMKHGIETPCSDGIAPSCSSVRIVLKCSGIRDPGGATLTSTTGWSLGLVHRATTNDASNGDMTILDIPFQLTLPDPENGKLKMTFDFGPCTGPLCPLFGPSASLPACASLEILSATLLDPDGNAFARLGSSGR